MWTTLGASDPARLTEARLNAHWACQLVASAGTSLLEPRPDDSHTNVGWEAGTGVLAGRALVADGDVRVALRVADLTLAVLRGAEIVEQLPLADKTLGEGQQWLTQTLGGVLGHDVKLELPTHDMPSHAVQAGDEFTCDAAVLAELERWIANAHHLLERFVRDESEASAVRLWPHHFDIASLITVMAHDVPVQARSVNVGFSFGDGSYAEPYAYVSPWPYPTTRGEPPALTYGSWHTEGFFAAILTGSTLLAGGGEGQAQRAETFLAQAANLSRNMLGVATTARRARHLV